MSSTVEKEVGLLVAIRERPLKDQEGRAAWLCDPESKTVRLESGGDSDRDAFAFHAVFESSASTEVVYDEVARDIVDGVLRGVNGTIFAYGQTSSGKTYTMQGGEAYGGAAGVMGLAAAQIFGKIAEKPDHDFLLRCSYVEVYNEQYRDLLAGPGSVPPIVREDGNKQVYLEGAKELVVTDAHGILSLVRQGETARSTGATKMNERSSRSHAVFRIVIESKKVQDEKENNDSSIQSADSDEDSVLVGALSLVDLAGSESARHTGATGQRLKEGGNINKSLLTLSRVVQQLGDRSAGSTHSDQQQPFVNFRDSKLTRLLQPTLGGDARLAMVCCVAPSEIYIEETRSTLQFARRAARVRLKPKVHEIMDESSQLRRVQRQLAELQRRQAEFDRRASSGKTEELSRLLNANSQLSAALHDKETALESQVETIQRLKCMIVLGGAGTNGNEQNGDLESSSRLGSHSMISRRDKKRETWAPGPSGKVHPLLMSAERGIHRGGLLNERRRRGVCGRDPDILLELSEEDSPGNLLADATISSREGKKEEHLLHAVSESPGKAAARLSELSRKSAKDLAAARAESQAFRSRAERSERRLNEALDALRTQCDALDELAEARGLERLTPATRKDSTHDDNEIGTVVADIRSRCDQLRGAADKAREDAANAQNEAYRHKLELDELREASEHFDAHAAELDEALEAARYEANQAQTECQVLRSRCEEVEDQLKNAPKPQTQALEDAQQRILFVQNQYESVQAQLDAAGASHAETVRELSRDLEAKEARIKRLDQVKMTTEIFKRIQQMQLDKARAEGENRELRDQLEMLERQLGVGGGSAADGNHPTQKNDSPLGRAAEALAPQQATHSLAAQLQLDELAKRSAELGLQLEDMATKLDTSATLARDLAATLGSVYDETWFVRLSNEHAPLCLAVEPETILSACKDAHSTEILQLQQQVANAVDRANAAEKAKLVAMTPAGRRATADRAGLQDKIDFLEKENLQLMVEIKDVRAASAKHKAMADDLKSKLIRLEQEQISSSGHNGNIPRSSLPPPRSATPHAKSVSKQHRSSRPPTPKQVAFAASTENAKENLPFSIPDFLDTTNSHLPADVGIPNDGPGECQQS